MKKKKTKRKAFLLCLIIITALSGLSAWIMASDPHGKIEDTYEDGGGGQYILYADGHLAVRGYAGGEPDGMALGFADRVKSMELRESAVTAESRPLFSEFTNLTELGFTDTTFEGDLSGLFSGCKNLAEIHFSDVSTSSVTNMKRMFQNCTGLRYADISGFDMSNVESVMWMFESCKSLCAIDLSGTDLSNVKNAQYMFQNCTALESVNLSGADLTGCANMTQMFSGCSGLKYADLSNIKASDDINAYQIFENCRNLETADLTGFHFGKTSLYSFFNGCSKLREVSLAGVNTSNVKAMNFMFAGCSSLKSLDLSGFDTSNATGYHDMFSGCTALEYLDVSGFDLTDTGSQMDRMFDGLISLKKINLSGWKTSGVTYMSYLFRNCKSLERLDLSGFDTSSVTNVTDMFTGCTALQYLDLSGFDLSRVNTVSGLFFGLSSLEHIVLSDVKVMTGSALMATNLFAGCTSLKYLDLSDMDLHKATMPYAFNAVGFWELKLPETNPVGFPCFSGNTPIEKPYYTWDGDWSCYMGGDRENLIQDGILQSGDSATAGQIWLDMVRIQNAGIPITIRANFTPIEYDVHIRFTDGDGNEVAADTQKYSIEEKEVFARLNQEYAEGMCSGYRFVGFTSEKLGVSGAKEIPAPEVPVGSIDITAVMEMSGEGTESTTGTEEAAKPPKESTPADITETTEPEETTEPSERTTEPPEAGEASEAGTSGEERTEAPEDPTERTTLGTETTEESKKDPAETAGQTEPGTKTTEGSETEPAETAVPAGSGTEPSEVTTPEEEFTSETGAETVSEAIGNPGESTVNTGDRGDAAAILTGSVICLCLIVIALSVCRIRSRKYACGSREKK